MLAKACACAVVGLEGALIEVEVDIGQGLPAFSIVGLPDAAAAALGARLPPCPQTGAHHRRSGWRGDHHCAPPGRGVAVSPARRRELKPGRRRL